MDGALEDRDGLGVDLCLGRRPAPAKRASPECLKTEEPTRQWRGPGYVK